MTIFSLLNETFRKNRDAHCLKLEDGTWLTYAETEALSDALAAYLQNAGVPDGGTVALDMPRSAAYAVCLITCALRGYCAVPLHKDYPQSRKDIVIHDSKADIVLTEDMYNSAVSAGDCPDVTRYGRYTPADDHLALYIFTSGSTGKPKGVMLDGRCVGEQALRICNVVVVGFGPDSVYGVLAPFTFVASIVELYGALIAGLGLIIIPEKEMRDPKLLADFCCEHRVTATFISPRVLAHFVPKGDSLKVVITGSEKVTGIRSAGYRLVNVYGQSELCGPVMSFEVDTAYDNTPIGKPMDGLFAYVLDDEGNETETGELCLSGHFFSGYADMPEQTRKTLVQNPFRDRDGQPEMVRTGDIVRRMPDGNIVYLNRNDWMIKLNGQRIEPGEIENVIRKVEGVTDAAVKDFRSGSGQVFLCAYITGNACTDYVREEIGKALPPYMIPAFIIPLDELPRTQNGKLDRQALPLPDAADFRAAYAAPETKEQKLLCAAFEQTLHVDRIGIHDDFFAMGGDSIKTLEVAGLCEEIGLSPETVLKGRTPGGIAALLSAEDTFMIPHSYTIPDSCPLTDAQRGVYFECMEQPDSLKYNIPACIALDADTDPERYMEAVRTVFAAHPVLNTVTKLIDGVPSMIRGKSGPEIAYRETDDMAEERRRFIRPFDLEKGPLYRFELCRCRGMLCFLFDIHHIVFDGSSLQVFVNEIGETYSGHAVPEEKLTLFDLAAAEGSLHGSRQYRNAQAFFDEKLAGMNSVSGPEPDVPELTDTHSAGTVAVDTASVLNVKTVEAFIRPEALTENTLFLGAFAYTLAKFGGSDECGFCSADSGRHDARMKNSVGMFVRTLPLHYTINEEQSVPDYLRSVQEDFFRTVGYDCISLGEVIRKYGIEENVMFVYQSDMLQGAEEIDPGEIMYPIVVMVFKRNGAYTLSFRYSTARYTEGLIRSLAATYLQVLGEMLRKERLNDISLLSPEQKAVLDGFNATDTAYDRTVTVTGLFREQALKHPQRTAVICRDKALSYAQADRISDRIAAYLAGEGIGCGDAVPILIPRCEYMVTASLGVLKCGAAYQPLDPSYPEDRLAFMVRDSGAKLLIADETLIGKLPSWDGKVLYTKDIPSLPECTVQPEPPKPEDLFILLYTSGSTGVPKGCMLEHRNLAAFCAWYRRYQKLTADSRVAAYASYGFDACMMDMYPALTAGAAVVIIPEDMRLDLIGLNRYFKEMRITHSFMTTQVGRQFARICDSEYLKYLSVGGEALVPLYADKPFRFLNGYGPTECTIFTTVMPVDRAYRRVPIGKPLDNMRLYVVDGKFRRLPVGAPGELCVSGPQVSRGYLNRPEKTAETYADNPFDTSSGYEKLYRTGDIVRYLPDGNIDFIGRNDGQVKVRGFRIELTEVEEVIRRYPGISDVTVAAFDAPGGGKFIAAYIVSDSQVDIEGLNRFIGGEKPSYMIPAVTMQIDRIPLNQNQKVNRKALPVPEFKAGGTDRTAPETDTEKKVFGTVSQVLGTADFGIRSDFDELGLTSISAIRLVTELGTMFSVPLQITDIRQNGNIMKLAACIDAKQHVSELPVQADYPLTKTQMGILAECMTRPDSVLYNIPVMLELNPLIETARLKKAIAAAVNAHPYMMTTLKASENGEVRQLREDTVFTEQEIREEEKNDPEEIRKAALGAFDLIGGRLFDIAVFTAKDTGNRYLLISIHHIIGDGFSVNILLDDISKAYRGEMPEKETYSGFEVSLTEQERSNAETLDAAKAVYGRLLEGCDGCTLPPRTVYGGTESAAQIRYTAGTDTEACRRFCRDNRITMSTLFNAAFAFTLGRFVYRDDVTYCTVYNGRSDSRMASIISMLVKTFPVRTVWEENIKVGDYLRQVENAMLDSMANDIYSFAEISHDYHINADILFTYQGDAFTQERFCGLACRTVETELDASKAPIDLDVVIRHNTLNIEGTYRNDMFSEAFIRALAKAVFVTVSEMMRKERLSDIMIADAADLAENAKHNRTKYPVPDEAVHLMFERQAELHPDSAAVIADDAELTYGMLNIYANRVAHSLLAQSVGKDEIIALITERGCPVFIGELGILKAGGAFLPMVPEYPDDRIAYCIKDAGCRKVVVTRTVLAQKKDFLSSLPVTVYVIEEMTAEDGTAGDTNPCISIPTDSLCYCIYTSGSTGTPKGVMIEHRNLRNFLDPNRRNPETANYVKYGSRVLSVISVSFDFSLMETLLPLCNGLSVCVAGEEEIHDPRALAGKITDNRVDVMSCTPSLISNMIDIPGVADSLRGMRLYDFGAEAFPKKLYAKLRKASPDAVICNGYGPTETTISCISKVLDGKGEVTIGKPAANVRVYICDKAMHELPPGAQGELVIGGAGVGRGYVKLPEKTDAVFVKKNRKKVYRSGDLARFLENGEIEFFGRLDNQVKLRGFRVELDEIENNINAYPGIGMSKAVVRNNGKEDYLAAFFTADRPVEITALKDFLKTKLTYYMVPAAMMQLDAMPLTANGKINTKELPEITVSAAREYVAPRNRTEQDICDVFAAVLNLEKIGATEDFFEIGGTSLTVMNVVLRLMDMGYNVVYRNLFDYPTPALLAGSLTGTAVKETTQSSITDYDYESINRLLARNTTDHVDTVRQAEIGDIILTGATGFLGIHILKEYLEKYDGTVTCLLRKGKHGNIRSRLDETYFYYFSELCTEKYPDRLRLLEGDITDPESLKQFAETDAGTVINCAACVKHFVRDGLLDTVNVQGVKNLIDICTECGKKLIQISTTSVGGMFENGSEHRLTEKELYFGQYIDNDYVRTKFLAERAILQAKIRNGLDGRIIRVGNLTSRVTDGEFQMNFRTNSFMRNLKAFVLLGVFPMSAMNSPTEFSPVDSTAAAILALTASENDYTVFEAYNNHIVYMSDVICALRHCGYDIRTVSDAEFETAIRNANADAGIRDALLGLIAYRTNDETPLVPVDSDNRMTVETLYRLDYFWPIIDTGYLYRLIGVLAGLGFFDP